MYDSILTVIFPHKKTYFSVGQSHFYLTAEQVTKAACYACQHREQGTDFSSV